MENTIVHIDTFGGEGTERGHCFVGAGAIRPHQLASFRGCRDMTYPVTGTWTNFVFNLQLACRHACQYAPPLIERQFLHLSENFDVTGWARASRAMHFFGLGLRHPAAWEALPSGKRLGQGRLRDREVGRRRDGRSCLSWRSVPPLSMPFSARPERREPD